MKISDPIMQKFTFNELVNLAQDHLIHKISISKNKEDLLLNLAKFYDGLPEAVKERFNPKSNE